MQLADFEIDEKRSALARVEAELGESEELLLARESVVEEEKRLAGIESSRRDLEFEIQKDSTHIAGEEEKLYGGRVRNPRELSGIELEVKSLKAHRSKLEDSLLPVMLEEDECRASLKEKRQALASVDERWRERQAQLKAEQAELKRALEVLSVKRAEALRPIEAEFLRRYEKLRLEKRGRALAPLEANSMCGGCRVVLPLTRVHEAKTSQSLVYCSSCGRILYTGHL